MSSLVQWLLEENRRHVQEYTSPPAVIARRQWRARHPIETLVIKCMDGRVNFANATGIPKGVVTLIRNMGGIVDLGWPAFGRFAEDWVGYATGMGRNCLVVVTYHYARGDTHRGCRGFDYQTEKAEEFAENLRREFENVFGVGPLCAVKMGIETDLNALILHGWNGARIDLAEVGAGGVDVEALYPRMPEATREAVSTFVQGNLEYLGKGESRSGLDLEHSEHVLAVGRGFEWIPNSKALIVGPFDPDLRRPIVTAAKILRGNMEAGRIGEEVVLLTAGEHRDSLGFAPRLAAEKAKYLREFALSAIRQEVRELLPHLLVLSGTVYMDTREFHVIHRS